jgi:hypothetical protein
MTGHHVTSPKKKNARTVPSAGNIVGEVSWDAEECILVDFLPRKETVNVVCYILTLRNCELHFVTSGQ